MKMGNASSADSLTIEASHATGHGDHRLDRLIDRLPDRLRTTVRWLRRPGARRRIRLFTVLGFWMFPLGLVLLADDVPPLTGCGRGFSTGSNAAIPNGSHRTADRSHAVSFARSAAACTITLMRYSGGCAPVTTRLKSKMKVGTPSMP